MHAARRTAAILIAFAGRLFGLDFQRLNSFRKRLRV